MCQQMTISEQEHATSRPADALCDQCGQPVGQSSARQQPLNDLAAIDIYAVPLPSDQ